MSVASTVNQGQAVALQEGRDGRHVAQEGQFRGAKVMFYPQQQSAQTLLQNAAEEMSFMAAHSRSQQRTLKERNLSTRQQVTHLSEAEKLADAQEETGSYIGQGLSTRKLKQNAKIREREARPGTTEHYEALRAKVPDLDEETLKSLQDAVFNDPPKSMEDLNALLGERFPDVTLRYVALMYLRKTLSETIVQYSNSDLVELVQLAREFSRVLPWINMLGVELFETQGAALKAGLNISGALMEFAHKKLKESVGELRHFYREAVLGYNRKLSDLYKKLLKKYGIKNFRQALRFLDRSISCDLTSRGPSVEKEKLQEMMDDTFVLRSLVNTHKDIAVLLRKTKYNVRRRLTEVENEAGERDVHGTVLTLIEFIEKGFYTNKKSPDLLKLLSNLGFRRNQLAVQINFMTGLCRILRELPLKMFSDDVKRLEMVRAMQATIDHLVESELG
ncbi:MAG: HrpJ domain-containing protein [Gammaproteobacteria bacterium]